MGGANEPHGTAFCSHENGVGSGGRAVRAHAPQQRAIADARRAEDDIFPVGQIIGGKDPRQIFGITLID